MQKNNGFTLIEVLIYLALVAMIALASAHWIFQLCKTCLIYEKRRLSIINLMSAHDTLVQDIGRAPTEITAWKMRESSRLIWHVRQGYDLCWMQEKDTLVRIEGVYNVHQNCWSKKTKNLVMCTIKKIEFNWHTSGDFVNYIDIAIGDTYNAIDNRIILMQKLVA